MKITYTARKVNLRDNFKEDARKSFQSLIVFSRRMLLSM